MIGPVTFQLTEDDWVSYYDEEIKRALQPGGSIDQGRRRFVAQSSIAGLGLFVVIFAMIGVLPALLLLGALLFCVALTYLTTPIQLRHNARQLARVNHHHPQRSEPVTVSLTERGVLESDSQEERLTLYEAITETTLTEQFLIARDQRGGVLLIPQRAFGSETAAQSFLLELDNRRLRQAVGLTPTVAPQTQVQPAAPPEESRPWWRSTPPPPEQQQHQQRK